MYDLVGVAPTVSGNDLTFTLNGFSYQLSLDNSGGNSNLINALTVTYDTGAFTLTTTNAEATGNFNVGHDAFAAGTDLLDDGYVSTYLAAYPTTHDYFVVVHDTTNINDIDMDSNVAGVQVLVYEQNSSAYCVVTLSEQPTSYAQLFMNNNYQIIPA